MVRLAQLPWKDGKAPPPVKERPLCLSCGKPLKPLVWRIYDRDENGRCPLGGTGREWHGYEGYGRRAGEKTPLFCTLKCALGFAEACVRKQLVTSTHDGHGRRVR